MVCGGYEVVDIGLRWLTMVQYVSVNLKIGVVSVMSELQLVVLA